MRRTVMASMVAACLLGSGSLYFAGGYRAAVAAPEPSSAPVSWELNIKHGPIERLQITTDGKQKTYWFMRYSVVNNTGKDILFTPDFELITDTGQVQAAYKDVPADIFGKIKTLYKNEMMLSPHQIVGKLLQGDDNAKDGVILFGDVETTARTFKVMISGLSGETAEVKNPVTGKPVVLQKTLVLEYLVPGEAIGIDPQPQYKGAKWVMK